MVPTVNLFDTLGQDLGGGEADVGGDEGAVKLPPSSEFTANLGQLYAHLLAELAFEIHKCKMSVVLKNAVNRLVEQVLLAGDQEDDEAHVDVMVARLLGAHSTRVQGLQDGDHQLLYLAAGQHVAAELVIAVEQEAEQQRGLLCVEGGGQAPEQAGVLQRPKLAPHVSTVYMYKEPRLFCNCN